MVAADLPGQEPEVKGERHQCISIPNPGDFFKILRVEVRVGRVLTEPGASTLVRVWH